MSNLCHDRNDGKKGLHMGFKQACCLLLHSCQEAFKHLAKGSITSDNNEGHDQALISFKKVLVFEKIINEWNKKDPLDQT